MKIVWHAQAATEFEAAVDYYFVKAGAEVAGDFRNEVANVTNRLRIHPEIGIRVRHQARRFSLHGYPYNLIYRLAPETIIIVALAHQRRRPGYWVGRR